MKPRPTDWEPQTIDRMIEDCLDRLERGCQVAPPMKDSPNYKAEFEAWELYRAKWGEDLRKFIYACVRFKQKLEKGDVR